MEIQIKGHRGILTKANKRILADNLLITGDHKVTFNQCLLFRVGETVMVVNTLPVKNERMFSYTGIKGSVTGENFCLDFSEKNISVQELIELIESKPPKDTDELLKLVSQ